MCLSRLEWIEMSVLDKKKLDYDLQCAHCHSVQFRKISSDIFVCANCGLVLSVPVEPTPCTPNMSILPSVSYRKHAVLLQSQPSNCLQTRILANFSCLRSMSGIRIPFREFFNFFHQLSTSIPFLNKAKALPMFCGLAFYVVSLRMGKNPVLTEIIDIGLNSSAGHLSILDECVVNPPVM